MIYFEETPNATENHENDSQWLNAPPANDPVTKASSALVAAVLIHSAAWVLVTLIEAL